MWGLFFSVIAGAAMSVQGVMNTKLSESVGLYESNVFVQGTAFLLSAVAALIMGGGGFGSIQSVEKVYLFGGVIGLVITITVMLGIKSLGPSVAISAILISQLSAAALIEGFGWLGAEKTAFGWAKALGIALMTGGMLLIKGR